MFSLLFYGANRAIIQTQVPPMGVSGGLHAAGAPRAASFGANQMKREVHTMENETKLPAAEQQPESEAAAGYPATTTCGTPRTRHRTPEEYQDLINRLNRVEGQVRGIRGMVEKDAYCPDILFQASAVSKALDSFCKELLGQHIRTCVVDDLEAGHYEAVDELVRVIQRLMK